MMWETKNLKFMKEKKTSGLLSSLGTKALLTKNPIIGLLLF